MHSLKFNACVTTFSTLDEQEQTELLQICGWMRNGFTRIDTDKIKDPCLRMVCKYVHDRTKKDTIAYDDVLCIRTTWTRVQPTITGGIYHFPARDCKLSTQNVGFHVKPGFADCNLSQVMNEAYHYQMAEFTIDGVDFMKLLGNAI